MKFSLVFLAAAAASAHPLSISGGTSTGGLLGGLLGGSTTSTGGLLGGLLGGSSTGTLTSGILGSLTGQISQITQLTQLPICAVTCFDASAKKLGVGSLSLPQIGTLCNDVTNVVSSATTCLAGCKLPVAQTTQVTSTLKSVCAAIKL